MRSAGDQGHVDIGHTRWLMAEQGRNSMPTGFLVIMVLWLAIMFAGFGLWRRATQPTGEVNKALHADGLN